MQLKLIYLFIYSCSRETALVCTFVVSSIDFPLLNPPNVVYILCNVEMEPICVLRPVLVKLTGAAGQCSGVVEEVPNFSSI